MTVYELFQGLTPISRVYLNDVISWKAPLFLHPHFAYIDTNGKLRVADGSIVAHTSLINRICTEVYSPKGLQNSGNPLSINSIHGDLASCTGAYIDGRILPLDTEMLVRDVAERVWILDTLNNTDAIAKTIEHFTQQNVLTDKYAFAMSARGVIGRHSMDVSVLIDSIKYGLATDSEIGRHFSEHHVIVDSVLSAINTDAELFWYTANTTVDVDYLNSAVSVDAELFEHASEHIVIPGYDQRAVSTAGKSSLHNINLDIEDKSHIDGLSTPIKQGVSDTGLDTTYSHVETNVNDLPANCLTGCLDEIFDCSYVSDMSPLSVNSIVLTDSNECECTEESYGGTISILGFDSYTTNSVTVDQNHALNTMIWIFPEKTDASLHIPELYSDGVVIGAAQNGSELAIGMYAAIG